MNGNDLRSPKGARQERKRVGRGGKRGTFSGRGMKGQSSRSGGVKGPGFEGGQTPWYRRLPKYRGFKNPFRTEYQEIGLGDLTRFDDGQTVTPEALVEKRIVKTVRRPVKVLGNGSLDKKLTVALHAFTASARKAIEDAGGKVEVI
ncbi:MAG: 50S ribosomal protein L15 [Armatimonadetes bacterium]|nr:50S ribosomal protein L15 [Armatimonadota bacterium]